MANSQQATNSPTNLDFKFQQLGSAHHLLIEDFKDLEEILELDEALWIATTAPVATLKADSMFLTLLDSDGDERIRAEELKDAIRFLLLHLTDYTGIRADNEELSLDAINTDTKLGQQIYISGTKVLKRLGKGPESVKLHQVREVKEDVIKGGLDQAGIVLAEATNDEKTKRCIEDILGTVGGREHHSGKNGIDDESLSVFFKECQQYLDWRLEAGDLSGNETTAILPLGGNTATGYELLQSISKKLTQYFLLCDVKRLNPKLLERALEEPEANIALNLMNINQAESYLSDAPISRLNPDGSLDLNGEMNPFFSDVMHKFTQTVIEPLLGKQQTLDKKNLQNLQKIFESYAAWLERTPEVRVGTLPVKVIAGYLSAPDYKDSLHALIAESHLTAFDLKNLKELERLLLYQMYILPLVNSFVSFPKLYDPKERALFEEGELVMDGRHFTLAIKVPDRKHHIETCKSSNIFVMYCELYGKDSEIKYEVAVPVTSGTRGAIHLNKWGIFNDRDGEELHAKVVDIVENPISIGEAVIDPFVRINRAFFAHLEDFSSKAEERLFQKEAKEKDSKKKNGPSGNLLAGGGVAIAAMGSSFAFITKTLSALTLKTVIIALLVAAGVIAIPAAIATYYKLSRRNLSTILEGSGWGLNARMKLTKAQAETFTYRPK
ncbi:MAG: hypothetical protein ACI8ZB_004147 [Desulforhopalus sp.]|jgi:hypothetical protein